MDVFLTTDWHIHTESSCDEASLPLDKLPGYAKQSGIRRCGITDHLHSIYNLPDIKASHANFTRLDNPDIHFGIELSVMSVWELNKIRQGDFDPASPPVYGFRTGGPVSDRIDLALTDEEISQLQIEYVVAGAHWPIYVPFEQNALITDYHRQQMFLAQDKRVDIIAHPWWWDNRNPAHGQQWAGDFSIIPVSLHDEFAAAVKQNSKLVEVNLGVLLSPAYTDRFRHQYAEYLRYLFESGVAMSVGSDCHGEVYAFPHAAARQLLGPLGFSDQDFSSPPLRQVRPV